MHTAPADPPRRLVDTDAFKESVDGMIAECGPLADELDRRLIRDVVLTAFKLVTDGRDTGELKLISAALKEMRYAYGVFADYRDRPKVTIFGSARTPPSDPDYVTAVDFSRVMADRGWLCITGAGDGIMKAGHEGPGAESSFGLAIRLPFETTANTVIAEDPKLITFRYFFTRKLMFLSQADAIVGFPGGFGTQDELFEALTLIQTGKSAVVPILLMEHPGGEYWTSWQNYVHRSLLGNGMISPEDLGLFTIVHDIAQAADIVTGFYRVYHSSRYVRDDLVIRLKHPLRDRDIATLNDEFSGIVREGSITQRGAYDVEDEFRELPRLAFTHTRREFGRIRELIDRINGFGTADG